MLAALNDTQQIIRKINQVKLYKEYNIYNFLQYPFVVSQKPINMIRRKIQNILIYSQTMKTQQK